MRAMNLPDATVVLLKQALASVPGLELAYVFGSIARGTERPQSDIDIAVQAPKALSAAELLALHRAVSAATGRSVDVVDLRRAGHPLLGEILRDGARLVGSADAHADLATRAALDFDDFFPYVQRTLATRRQAWLG